MPDRNRKFDCYISWAHSPAAQCDFPILSYRADVDYATSGLASLTSIDRNEVVAVMIAHAAEFDTDDALAERVNSMLGRRDLRVPTFVRSEDKTTLLDGLSFQEFRRLYQPPRLFYTDIYAIAGEAEAVRKESIEEFLQSGGILTDLITNGRPDIG